MGTSEEHHPICIASAHQNPVQLIDVGCSGPFEKVYQQEAHTFMSQSVGRSVTRYDVSMLAYKIYYVALRN